MKNKRQEKILDIIEKYNVGTQEDLVKHLMREGFDVTQATISRDIKELKLAKGTTPDGICKYAVVSKKEHVIPRFNSALTESITKVDYAGNLIVVKTYPGMANAVATCIDSFNIPDIIGCVAGDDAILVVARDQEMAYELSDKIRHMIRSM